MKFILRIVFTASALMLATYIVPGIAIDSAFTALVAALSLGVLNAFIRPVLILLTLPITIVTLGLFIFVINAGMFWFVAIFIDGFFVQGFLNALLGSIFVSIVSGIAHRFV